MTPLRILSIGHADSPQYAERTARLAGLGHEVLELTGGPECVSGLPALVPRGLPLGGCWRGVALTRILHFLLAARRTRPDVVLVHYARGLWAWLAPLLGRPVALSVMGGDVLMGEQGTTSGLERRATANLLRAAALTTCKTPHLAGQVRDLGACGEVITCSWGVDHSVFHSGTRQAGRAQLGLDQDDLLVFSPRVMQPLYNIELAVRAFARLAREQAHARLFLSTYRADPAYAEGLRQLVGALGLSDRAHFLPPLDRAGMAAHLAAADICISLPASDGLPQTFLEAAACGVPLLCSDLPHYRDRMDHSRNAWLVARDEHAVADALLRLARDPELRRAMAAGALQTLEELENAEGLPHLDAALRRASQAGAPAFGRGPAQLAMVLAMLALGRPVAARQGQPVFPTWRAYFAGLAGRREEPCAA